MKRKNEHGEGQDVASPTPKRTRSANRGSSSKRKETANEIVTTPSKKRAARNPELSASKSDHADELTESAEESEVEDALAEAQNSPQEEGEDEAGAIFTEEEPESPEMQITPMRPSRTKTIENIHTTTPKKNALIQKLFATPTKTNGTIEFNETPRIERNADRSARKKSTRSLIERTILGNISDNDDDEEDIAQHIYGDSGDEELAEDVGDMALDSDNVPATPSKRGRPKGSKNRKRSPTPPQDMPPWEKYFFQNRGGRVKTSNNNLSTLALLDHEEFFSRSRKLENSHQSELDYLQSMHSDSFDRWLFELSQGFNICLFGWGSKRSLLMKFADHVYKSQTDHATSKIVIINGYVQTLTVKDVLNSICSAITKKGQSQKLGSQPPEMLDNLLALLEEDSSSQITLMIHSIDQPPLRRPATQTILSRLSSHPQIQLLASADHPSFPLLWDSSLRSTYNFLFHDCTTFQSYTTEIDVVDEVHELLGRSGRRVGGKEGVSFVLKSLPENAKNLFRVLIGEQLAAMGDGMNGGGFGDDEDDDEGPRVVKNGRNASTNDVGVEYRVLYQKAVEEFICSNEMNFRTLLKEFHDHQMIQSRKDTLGTELLSVPFRKEELETILEDIMS